ncbi:hypothetical protein [Nocardia asteroides]|uniref:hypothetical protein n=1 Tax=Nocardia asteroides TaxID=1824 RepID=UPI0033C0001E
MAVSIAPPTGGPTPAPLRLWRRMSGSRVGRLAFSAGVWAVDIATLTEGTEVPVDIEIVDTHGVVVAATITTWVTPR